MDVDERIRDAANKLRSLDAVMIIGAGCSFEQGVPLTRQLQNLLWDAFDADEDALEALSTELKVERSSAKKLIGLDDSSKETKSAYKILASHPKARSKFQHSFAGLNKERISRPSPAHDVIAELLHRRIIKMVISLNWDTLLETAYHRKYGSVLQSGGPWLKKPHGDAANPESEWLFPYQDGNIPEEIVKDVQEIASKYSHILLIVGYSEGDEEVVSKLIDPLSDKWEVIRIGLDKEKSDIQLGAQEALKKILKEIYPNPEVPGWEYVNFDNQRDLGSALWGLGLGPADVEICPRLPEVDIVKKQLDVTKRAVIVGKSGCGKSLVAYQAAYDMMKDGWEVLRLAGSTNLEEASVSHVESLPQKTVLIIDNAQSSDQRIAHNLLEKAYSKLAVIVVSTDDVPLQWKSVKIARERAVSIISEAFKGLRDKLLPIVRELDPSVGEGCHYTSLEDRISEAAAESDRPWQFNFILTGGWLRAEQEIANLREEDRADLLLASIAAKQIVSLDANVSRAWLERASHIFEKDGAWLDNALQLLLKSKNIIDEKTIRCPHMRFSIVVLDIISRDRNDEYWNELIRMLREALVYETPPLLGINWLLNHLSEAFRRDRFETIVDDDTWEEISQRCWAANSGKERGHAAFVLAALLKWYPSQFDALASNSDLLSYWIQEVNSNSAFGLAKLLSSLSQKDHSLAEKIVDYTNPSAIANSLARASLSEAFSWGWFLFMTNGIPSPDWHSKLARELNASALKELFKRAKVEDLESISMLASGIGLLNHNLALDLVDLSVTVMGRALTKDISKLYYITIYITPVVLGFSLFSHWDPSNRQKEVASHLVGVLDSYLIGRSISNTSRRYWESCAEFLQFILKVSPTKANDIVSYINFNKLDETARRLWDDPPLELTNLIGALAVRDDCEPARSWVNKHDGELVALNPIIVAVGPEASVTALKSGNRLNLDLGFFDWSLATMALRNLSMVDKYVAVQVLEDNVMEISESFHLTGIDLDFENLPEFLSLMQEFAPEMLVKIFELINPNIVEKTWADRLRGKADEKQAVAALLDAVISFGPASLAEVAAKFRRRFPISSVVNSTTPN